MDAQTVQAAALVGILICNIIVLSSLVIVGLKVLQAVGDIKKTVGGLSEKGHKAIDTVQKQVTELAGHIRPTVTNARHTVTGVTDTVSSVQRSVKTAEGIVKQVAAPAALAIFAARVLRINGMVVGALGFAAGMFAKQQMDGKTPLKQIKLPSRLVPSTTAVVETKSTERQSFDTANTPLVTVSRNGAISEETKPPILAGVVTNS